MGLPVCLPAWCCVSCRLLIVVSASWLPLCLSTVLSMCVYNYYSFLCFVLSGAAMARRQEGTQTDIHVCVLRHDVRVSGRGTPQTHTRNIHICVWLAVRLGSNHSPFWCPTMIDVCRVAD